MQREDIVKKLVQLYLPIFDVNRAARYLLASDREVPSRVVDFYLPLRRPGPLNVAMTRTWRPVPEGLRLTLLYTPGISNDGRGYSDQSTQDWGRHEFTYGLAGHSGDWRTAQTDWQALRLNQPPLAFETQRR